MKATKTQLVELFADLGFKSAGKWSAHKMNSKIDALAEMAEDPAELDLTEDQSKLLADLLDALEDNEDIELEGYADEAADKPKAKTRSKKAGKAKGKTENASKAQTRSKKAGKGKGKPKGKTEKDEAADKPKTEKGERKPSRQATVIRYVRDSKKKTLTVDEIAEGSNEAYVAVGGKDNAKDARFYVGRIGQLMAELGYAEWDGKTLRKIS